MDSAEQEALFEDAWALLDEIIHHGTLTPKFGKQRDATVREMLSAVHFLASKRVSRVSNVKKIDNLRLGRTDG